MRLKYIYVCVFFFFNSYKVDAQKLKKDSLVLKVKEMEKVKSIDTNYINTLNHLAYAYYNTNADSMAFWARKALKYSENIHYKKGISISLRRLGTVYVNQDKLAEAMFCYQKALKLAEETHDNYLIALTYINISSVYQLQDNYKVYLEYNLKALNLLEKIKDKEWSSLVLLNIGGYYTTKNNHEKALEYYQKAYNIADKNHNESTKASIQNHLGHIFLSQKRFDIAKDHFLASLGYYQKVSDTMGLSDNYCSLASLYFEVKNYPQVLEYGLLGLNLAQKTKKHITILTITKILSATYKIQQKYQEALSYHELYKAYNDTLFNETQSKKIGYLEAQFEFDKKQQQILFEQKQINIANQYKIDKQQSLIYILCVLFILVITTSLIIYYYKHKVSITNRLLYEKNIEVEAQNEELKQQNDFIQKQSLELEALNNLKSRLFSIISHDLRSPLGSLKGLMSLLNDQTLSKESFYEFSEELLAQVNNIGGLMDSLLHWANSQMRGTNINFKLVDITTLINKNIQLLNGIASNKNVTIFSEPYQPVWVYIDEDMIDLVLRNLISNAIKFCSSGDKVSIYIEDHYKVISVSVKDTGVGISEENINKIMNNAIFSTSGTDGEKGTGLGLVLCKDFIEKNQGKFVIKSDGKGATFMFTLCKYHEN